MSDGSGPLVECPVCETEFDPTAAGGWCTNSECGEWQYIGEEVPEPAETSEADESPDGPAAGRADAPDEPADPAPSEADGQADGTDESDPTPAITSTADDDAGAGAPNDPGTPDDDAEAADQPDPAGQPDPAAPPESAAGSAAGDDADADEGPATPEPTCPDCGTDVDADDSFCADCGADLDAVGEPTLDACPDCGADVDADDSFCASCGADLDEARADAGGAGDEASEEATADAPAGGDEAATGGGQALATPDAADEASLVLRARGEELTVVDGETVGREVRRLVTETGGDQDDAVLIHREHVRFVREDGRFYLVDLGDNPTAVNGARLSKGDREPVEPGDEIELSGVVTMSVEAP